MILLYLIGATPRHATLFARDVPPSHAIRILDRFIMYYIRTADKLMRTARWVEQMDGGIEVGDPSIDNEGQEAHTKYIRCRD